MKKKILTIIFISIFTFALLTACGQTNATSDIKTSDDFLRELDTTMEKQQKEENIKNVDLDTMLSRTEINIYILKPSYIFSTNEYEIVKESNAQIRTSIFFAIDDRARSALNTGVVTATFKNSGTDSYDIFDYYTEPGIYTDILIINYNNEIIEQPITITLIDDCSRGDYDSYDIEEAMNEYFKNKGVNQ